MKFGQAYKDILEHGGFPPDWVKSAISYRQLKKCIKQVNQELASLGLDAQALELLLQRADERNVLLSSSSSSLQKNDSVAKGQGSTVAEVGKDEGRLPGSVRPKLLFLVDEETGEPLDASLAPETKRLIHELAVSDKLAGVSISAAELADAKSCVDASSKLSGAHGRLIEVPLTSDSEFFSTLQNSLSGLASVQEAEQSKLDAEIKDVGSELVKATDPTTRSGKADLDRWRRIFELYVDSRIFYATNEKDHGLQRSTVAQERYATFLAKGTEAKLLEKFKTKESLAAWQQFLAINMEILQNLRFQEVNQTAMVKILKKFDKRTALPSPPPAALTPTMLSKTLSQHLSATISSSILSTVPALSDYLCPVCSELAWRPVRLTCSHIFCIRCLIRLQKEKKDRCPLCRGDVVMKANSGCLDESLVRFMKLWFSNEVKDKQRLNERLAHEELYGPEWESKCAVM